MIVILFFNRLFIPDCKSTKSFWGFKIREHIFSYNLPLKDTGMAPGWCCFLVDSQGYRNYEKF